MAYCTPKAAHFEIRSNGHALRTDEALRIRWNAAERIEVVCPDLILPTTQQLRDAKRVINDIQVELSPYELSFDGFDHLEESSFT
jgi:hypothetical protein